MVDFSALKSRSGSNLAQLTKAVIAMNTSNKTDDSDYWKCELDKAGNGFAIIRFLPVSEKDYSNDALPWIKYYDHGFQSVGGWYIEKSLTTFGKEDPVSEYNRTLWETGLESNKEIVRKQKRRLHYVSNILIVKDSKNPENEGKVFKYTYGKKIFEKISGAMQPQFEDDVAFDPFDLWSGANFKLKIRKVEGYGNYDMCEFESPSPISEDDEEIERIWKSEFSLLEIVDPKNFKTYEELDSRLKRVLGQVTSSKFKTAEDYTSKTLDEAEDDLFIKKVVEKPESGLASSLSDEPDDDMAYYNSLLADE